MLLESGRVEEAIFAVLCKLGDRRETIARILRRIAGLPAPKQREAVAQLLVLPGLRGLKSLVEEEVKTMPVSIDIHENEFLEEIYQDGRQQGSLATARQLLLGLAEEKFGTVTPEARQRVESAGLDVLQIWGRRLVKAETLDQIFV